MLNKKGYMITPMIFIVFMIIAIAYSVYMYDFDSNIVNSIQTSAKIEKGIQQVYETRINQVNFAKLSAYQLSNTYCYNESGSNTQLENEIEKSLDKRFGGFNWYVDISGNELSVRLPSGNITTPEISINYTEYSTKELLNTNLLSKC